MLSSIKSTYIFQNRRQCTRTQVSAQVNWEAEVSILNRRVQNLRSKESDNFTNDLSSTQPIFSEDAMSTLRKRCRIERFHQKAIQSRPNLPLQDGRISSPEEFIQEMEEWHMAQWNELGRLNDDLDDGFDEANHYDI
eukprot:TRINITY_DN26029_c1_g1_i1.p3 TRINITY_DN26029_c1_g1~~TRINITY_DN26029_c1_g1_i1.p3  ORF type:complete len:137 (-),score=12.66 TRINITY_DN26029_c1_g1_i1:211-621(-)